MSLPERLRVGVIVDRRMLARWQVDALRTIRNEADLLVYSCTNPKPGRRRMRHALYYLLNLFTIRNPLTRPCPWPSDLPVEANREFEAVSDAGDWQRLPDGLLAQIKADRIDALVKFGMGLLRIPPADALPVPILSYHHGDPAAFRGRPAGFYEMLSGANVMGQVVQRLTNQLDAGEIVAFAETRVAPHSYRQTLIEAYRQSPLILRPAIAACLEGRGRAPAQPGKIYRLPSSGVVTRFLIKQTGQALARLSYGLTKEKGWFIATAPIAADQSIDSLVDALKEERGWSRLATPRGYRFLADPFFHPDGGLLVEGLNSRSNRGEILHVADGEARPASGRGGHYSYPATCFDDGAWHVLPEVSEWSPAMGYRLDPDGLGQPFELAMAGRPRLLDPTPFRDGESLYLFANLAEEGSSVLRLWMSDSLSSRFVEHPDSPIRISPNGSRMGGGLLRTREGLIRVGQDLRGDYGNGISLFRVTRIGTERYEEEWIRTIRFNHCKGPHTLNVKDGRVAFDYYRDKFTLLAGFRRLRERRAALGDNQ